MSNKLPMTNVKKNWKLKIGNLFGIGNWKFDITRKAFTLIELLITTAIMALVSAAILSVLAGGVNVYNRVRNLSGTRTDILFALEKMESGLKNACNISQIEFIGESKKITFPSVVSIPSGDNESLPLGSVSYYIDNSSHDIVSNERDYSAATAMDPPKGFVTQSVYAADINFSYYYYDTEAKAYYWKDAWVREKDEDGSKKKKLKPNTPLAVKIEVKYEENGRSSTLERTVFFPLAVSLHLAQIAGEKENKEAVNVQSDENKG